MDMQWVLLQTVQVVCTKPRIYLADNPYLGTDFDSSCNCF